MKRTDGLTDFEDLTAEQQGEARRWLAGVKHMRGYGLEAASTGAFRVKKNGHISRTQRPWPLDGIQRSPRRGNQRRLRQHLRVGRGRKPTRQRRHSPYADSQVWLEPRTLTGVPPMSTFDRKKMSDPEDECVACDGTGICSDCDGEGILGEGEDASECTLCDGDGNCHECAGDGETP